MNNLVIYGLIALVVLIFLYKGRSYFTPGSSPAPGPPPQWKMTTIIEQGKPCPSGWTKVGDPATSVTCAQ